MLFLKLFSLYIMQAFLNTLSQPSAGKPRIISVEGNIGAGKSTLLRKLEKNGTNGKVVFMQEPVDQWSKICDAEGNTILSCFYADAGKYAFPFQVLAYTSRLAAFKQVIRDHPDCEVIVCERSLEADRFIFAEMMRDQGTMEPMLYEVYRTLYDATAHEFQVNTVVYLETTPAKCLERIHKRDREGEDGISLEYLTRCQTYYEKWLRLVHVVRIESVDEEQEDEQVSVDW